MTYIVNDTVDLSALTLHETDTVKSVLQNISIILRTRKGTVPMYRDFGIPHTFLDKPIPLVAPILYAEIYEAIEKYEPRAKVLRVDFTDSGQTGKMIPTVEVEIRE